MIQEKTNKDNEQDYFNQSVREKVENYRAFVDDNCWEEIEQALTSNRSRVSLWIWISTTVAASLALLLLLRTSFPETSIEENRTTELMDNFNEENNQPEPESIINSVISLESKKSVSSEKKVKQISEIEVSLTAEKTPKEETQTGEALLSQNTEDQSIPDRSEKKIFDKPTANWSDSVNEWEQEPIKKKENKWLLAASFGSGSGSLLGNGLISGDQDYLVYTPSNGITNSDFASSEKINDIFYPEEFSDVTHYAPLSFGINIRKDINNRWAIESGLTYTYLLSKFRNQQPQQIEATMEMHYIGVPLNLVAYISNSNPHWSLYASAGGMVEKGLQLNFTRNRYNDRAVFETKLKENIPGFQYSLNASIGVSYKIHKEISLYFEPRINYYLNNNQPKSIRTENPFIVGFNTGLRLGL